MTLDVVSDASRYLDVVRARLAALSAPIDVAIYNAGMDVHEGCRTGGRPGFDDRLLAAREQLVFDWARRRRVPIAFVLAGGHTGPEMTEQRLVDLHRLTIETAARVAQRFSPAGWPT